MAKGPVIIVRDPSGSLPQVDARLTPKVEADIRSTVHQVRGLRDRLHNEKGKTSSGEMQHIGRIPAALYFGDTRFFRDDDFLLRWLRNNPEFQVGKGKI